MNGRSPLTPRIRTDLVRALPTFVQRAILEVRVTDKRIKTETLRKRFEQTKAVILEYVEMTEEWLQAFDASLERAGAEYVDKSDPAQVAEFLKNIPEFNVPKSLQKRELRQSLVAVARLELERLEAAIVERERHGR